MARYALSGGGRRVRQHRREGRCGDAKHAHTTADGVHRRSPTAANIRAKVAPQAAPSQNRG